MNSYYKILVRGRHVRQFLDKLIQNKINLYDISYNKNELIFITTYQEYIKIKKLNIIYDIKILKIIGINKYKNMINANKIFFILFFIFIFFIFLYSKMIFFININTDNPKIKNIIETSFSKNNIEIFSLSKNYKDLDKVASKIKEQHSDIIEWISINHVGVSYEVNLIEKITKKEVKFENINDIVSSNNGIIKNMYIESGEILKNIGDYVSKGDIIVSSKITKDDEIKNIVNAKGKVYAETWYKIKLSSSQKKQEQINENGYISLIFNIFSKNVTILKIYKNDLKKEKINNIINTSILKIYIKKEYEKNIKMTSYNLKYVIRRLEKEANRKMLSMINMDEKILSQKTLKIINENDRIEIEVFFKIYENIASYKEVNFNTENITQKE